MTRKQELFNQEKLLSIGRWPMYFSYIHVQSTSISMSSTSMDSTNNKSKIFRKKEFQKVP